MLVCKYQIFYWVNLRNTILYGHTCINIFQGPELLNKYIGASEQAVRDTFLRYLLLNLTGEVKTEGMMIYVMYHYDLKRKPNQTLYKNGLQFCLFPRLICNRYQVRPSIFQIYSETSPYQYLKTFLVEAVEVIYYYWIFITLIWSLEGF